MIYWLKHVQLTGLNLTETFFIRVYKLHIEATWTSTHQPTCRSLNQSLKFTVKLVSREKTSCWTSNLVEHKWMQEPAPCQISCERISAFEHFSSHSFFTSCMTAASSAHTWADASTSTAFTALQMTRVRGFTSTHDVNQLGLDASTPFSTFPWTML